MIRTFGLIAVAGLFATAAHAAVTTIEYQPAEGDAVVVAYDDATSTATNKTSGNSGPYTWDEASSTVCSNDADGNEVCVTFESAGTEVGHKTPFTTNDGRSGTATIVSVE